MSRASSKRCSTTPGSASSGRRRLRPLDGPDPAIAEAIDRAERPVVLAGPGVVLAGAVEGLRALAAAGSLGVLNTWGAKGVFDWRSPHHLATAGLQARDFERGGLADADLIITTGLDEREVLAEWELAPAVDVAPRSLAWLARAHRARASARSRCRRSAPSWRGSPRRGGAHGGPLPPTKVTQHYSQVLGDGGLVAADPGTAGYWVARTFATQHLGGVHVTARPPTPKGSRWPARRWPAWPTLPAPVLAVVDQLDGPHVAGARGRRPPRGRGAGRGLGGRRTGARCRGPRGPPPRPRARRPARRPSPPTRRSSTRCSRSPAPIVAWS